MARENRLDRGRGRDRTDRGGRRGRRNRLGDDAPRPSRTERRFADVPPAERAAALKERVYVTFTAVAVLLAIAGHGEHVDAASTAISLVLTTLGVLLAGSAAELIAHIVVHDHLPRKADFVRLWRIGVSAFGAVVVPLILLLIAVGGAMPAEAALRASIVLLLVTIGAISLIALRGVHMPQWQRVLVTLGFVGVIALVVALQVLAHSV